MNVTELNNPVSEAMAEALGGILTLSFYIIIIRIVIVIGIAALITWVVKKVWNAGNGSKKAKSNRYNHQNEDWLSRAKRKEDTKFNYLNSHIDSNVGGYAGNPKAGVKWYPTGWTYNDKTGKWDPPDYLRKESKDKWRWDANKGIWIDQEKEERLEKYRKYHEGRPPTFEEWKANREKQEIDSTPANTSTEQGTYRYDYIHLADEEVHIPKTAAAQNANKPVEANEPEKQKTGYEDAYEATPILTYNESRNFKALQEAAYRKGYMICPKVRLADIIKPRSGDKYLSHFGKIKSKHVDFVVCDQRMNVLAVIELDDKSHDRPDRIERDQFVDSILEANGIKVIHTRHITDNILDGI